MTVPVAPALAPLAPESLTLSLYGSAMMMLTLRGDLLRDRFEAFRGVCKDAGGTSDRAGRQVVIDREKVGALLGGLATLGFSVEVRPHVQLALDFDEKTARERHKRASVVAAEKASALDRRLAPHLGRLFPFQKIGIEWLAPRDRALLCDEMGLGKTYQFLLALPAAERGGAPPGVLVVCPAAAKGVWAAEARAHRPDLRVFQLKGENSFRWPAPGELVITNYDILPKPADIDTSPMGQCYLIGDELHYCKKAASQRTVRFRAIREKVTNCGGVTWGGTGTPLCDRAQDLWAIAQAMGLARDAFGTWDSFVALYDGERIPCPACKGGVALKKCSACHGAGRVDNEPCAKCTATGRATCKACKGRKEILGELLTPSPEVRERFARIALRRLRKDVLPELPGKRYQTHPIALEDAFTARVDEMLPDNWEDIVEEAMSSSEGAAFGELAHARAVLAEAKTAAAVELAESFGEENEPLVFFSCHAAPLDALSRLEGWALLDGSTPAERRTEIAEAFQRGELRGIAANVRAGGTAITLTRAAHVAFVDESWTPADNAQAQDRVCRIGQTRGVVVHRLVADHALDVRVAEILEAKTKLIEGSLGG